MIGSYWLIIIQEGGDEYWVILLFSVKLDSKALLSDITNRNSPETGHATLTSSWLASTARAGSSGCTKGGNPKTSRNNLSSVGENFL